jgi:pteridine reductase
VGAERPIALVTGGARRVGRATCLALHEAGCEVHLTYRTSGEEARELAGTLSPGGDAEARVHQLDLDDLDAVSAFAARFGRGRGRVDVVVHNASIYGPTALADVDAESALRHYRVNALAPLLLTAGLADALRGSVLGGGGCVVCMCDVHVMGHPREGFSPYAMSKAALVEMVRSLAVELAPEVRVVGVAPGVVRFPEEGYESDEASRRAYLERVPLGRTGSPEDAASLVRYLALEAGYVTGQVIPLDGGRSLG